MPPAYREYAPPARISPSVACLWENQPAHDRWQRIVPDGCVDLVWLAGRELVFVGADTGPQIVRLPAGSCTSGIRFRPGAAGAVLGLPASEIRDQRVAAELIWGRDGVRLRDAMAAATPAERLRLLAEAVGKQEVEPDPLVTVAARSLAAAGARVGQVAADLGVSERHLHRRTLAAVGYGPKMLARVARLRRLIASTDRSLAARALTAGYASQAHMSDEVRRLTGNTPVRFLEDAELTVA